jgi:2'-5' RNA ligase
LIQQKYKNNRWNIALPPHITLMPPAQAILPNKEAIEIIEKTVCKINKFEIEITDVSFFRNYYHIIYITVKSNPKLNELYKKVISSAGKIGKIEGAYKSFNFIPHITLSNDLTEEEFNQKYSKVQELSFNSKFICDKILLFAKEGNQKKYRIIGEVKLGE